MGSLKALSMSWGAVTCDDGEDGGGGGGDDNNDDDELTTNHDKGLHA